MYETATWCKDFLQCNMFFLKCCLLADCPHPLCQLPHPVQQTWYPGGPPLSYFPVPVPDPAKPWGSVDCEKCKGVCNGHFLSPEEALLSNLPRMIKPPSQLIKEAFNRLNGEEPSDVYISQVASQCLQVMCVHGLNILLKYRRTDREVHK